MTNRVRSTFRVLSILFLSAVVFSGCRENTLINSRLSPANDTAGVEADTLGCITRTYIDNDVITSNNIVFYQGVGSITDSFFGNSTFSTFFQIDNPNGIYSFPASSNYVFDSFVLNLPFGGFIYGDTTGLVTETYQAFLMQDTIGYNTIYFPYSDKPIDIAMPLSEPVTVNLKKLYDSVATNGVNRHPALRLKLNYTAFMARFNAALAAGNANTTDKSQAFINAFKGICIRQANTRSYNKAVPYFRLDGNDAYTSAGVLVYYHLNSTPMDTTKKDPLQYFFNPGKCGHFNKIDRSYSRFPLNALIQSTQPNADVIAIQNQPGAAIDVKIYGINSIPKDVVVNKAVLQISMLPTGNNAKYAMPDQLYPLGIANGTFPAGITAGNSYTVADRSPLSSSSPYQILDGTSHNITYGTTGITTYTIGIPREVIASMAAGNDTLHYHIRGTQLFYGAYRMVAAGGNYSDYRYRAKLIVVHSSLKK